MGLNNYAIGDLPFSNSLIAAGTRYGFSGTISPAENVSTNSVIFSGYYDIPTKSKFMRNRSKKVTLDAWSRICHT